MNKKKKKILAVEDEEEFAEMLKIRFESKGFEVFTANDGREGLKLARKEKPDLIILDLMLPKLDGFQVCRMLKFDNRFKNIPIIMLTARSEDKDKNLGEEVGADAYMTKIFEWDELYEKVDELL